jgi:hypothetical protein
MNNTVTSEYRNKKYQTTGTVRLLNQKQAAFYWSRGVEPLDIYLSKNFETGEPRIVYIFSREDTKELYLGTKLLSNEVSATDFEALKGRVKTLEDWKTEFTAAYNAHLTAQDARDDGQDELIAGLRKDLNDITEVGGEPNKVDDVTVNEISVVENKIAKLKKLAGKDTVATADIDAKAVTKEKLADVVQTSLGKADTAVQYNAETNKLVNGATNSDITEVNLETVTIETVTISNNYGSVTFNEGGFSGSNQGAPDGFSFSYADIETKAGAQTKADNAESNAKKYTDEEITGLEFGLSADGKELSLKNKAGTAVATLDTTKFVKDGMISSVAISEDGTKLVITWNTDAGISATEIPLTELVDVMTGVDGTTITVNVSADDKISAEVKTASLKDGHIASDAAIAKGKLAADVQASLDKAGTAVQPAAISDMMTKTEHTTFVNGNAALNSGITADKVGLYDTAQTTVASKSENWDEAYSWGNHADAGYADGKTTNDDIQDIYGEIRDLAKEIGGTRSNGSGYTSSRIDALESTVNSNKETWDKAGTSVQVGNDITFDDSMTQTTLTNGSIYFRYASGEEARYTRNGVSFVTESGKTGSYAHADVVTKNWDGSISITTEGMGTKTVTFHGDTLNYDGSTLVYADIATKTDAANAAKAVQGSTTNTVKDCVDAINALNEGTATANKDIKAINHNVTALDQKIDAQDAVTLSAAQTYVDNALTWGSF